MANMTEILGERLLTSVEKEERTNEVMKDKEIVLLYFSASWCPPCKRFTPTLAEFYNNYCKKNKVEIVYISSDYDIPSFTEYYSKMPWCSLPPTDTAHIKQKLADRLRISGIPCLVALDKNGLFLSDQSRNEVTFAAGSETKCNDLINKWKNTEAVPIEDAKLSGGGPSGILKQILMKLLSNPMYLVGLYYLVRKFIFKFQETSKEHEESEL